MILTNKQEQGLKEAITRYRNGEKYVCIAGYAGSGKSTLVQYIIKELNIPENKIAYCCYTGRAACILKSKGCPGATTAHKLLYNTIELPIGNDIREIIKKELLENGYVKNAQERFFNKIKEVMLRTNIIQKLLSLIFFIIYQNSSIFIYTISKFWANNMFFNY